jgi:serine/threonine protein phosphatase PrpC
MTWQFDLATEIGGRGEQQDRVAVLALPARPGEHLVILADGMGGQQQGAIAAQAVIDTARSVLSEVEEKEPRQFLTDLCLRADETIREIGKRNNTNPASTCTALYTRGEEAYWIHVGDSRLCQFNADNLISRTRDHTVAELLNADHEDPHASRRPHPADNRLYMCLGGQNELEPQFGASAVGNDDWFMICSDGFWSQVGEEEVAGAWAGPRDDRRTASDLAMMATERGGPGGDNVSLALVMPGSGSPDVKKAWWRF